MEKISNRQEPRDTTQPVLVIEEKELTSMTYMELREAFKFRGIKQNEIIKLMAKRLLATVGNRFTKPQIKGKIVEDLGEYTTDAYVRKVLGPEYADQRFNSAKSKKAVREFAKAYEGARSDLKVTLIFTEEMMDGIDEARGKDSVNKYIMDLVRNDLKRRIE